MDFYVDFESGSTILIGFIEARRGLTGVPAPVDCPPLCAGRGGLSANLTSSVGLASLLQRLVSIPAQAPFGP